jgi:TRAP-type uncharacterized transport system fused permease subunit
MHAETGAADQTARPRAVALTVDVLQGVLIFCVVAWVIDLPRRLFGWSFYSEQLLAVCLGLGLAISFLTGDYRFRWIGWAGAVAALAICGFITFKYDEFTYEIALLPMSGIIGSFVLILLVLEGTRRTAGSVLVAIILLLCAYVFIGRTCRATSPPAR